MARWRLIRSGEADGHRNMALDEALLESCLDGGAGFPCLRLYSFAPPCLSLGAHQSWESSVDLGFCRKHGIDVVRRPTGGQAVLHADEVTYAVVARIGAPPFGPGVRASYDAISEALVFAFASVGVPARVGGGRPARAVGGAVCFAGTGKHEIGSGEWKIAGSAQVRRRGAFLQHGSLPLEMDPSLLAGATRSGGAGEAPPDVRGLSRIAGRRVSPEELAEAVVEGFRTRLGAGLVEGPPTPAESVRAEWLRGHKYLTTAWCLRR